MSESLEKLFIDELKDIYNAESQLEGKLAAAAFPNLRVRFVPCLNGSPALADVIASQVASVN